jgi:hypothetical protein
MGLGLILKARTFEKIAFYWQNEAVGNTRWMVELDSPADDIPAQNIWWGRGWLQIQLQKL